MDREQARTYAKSCLASYLTQRGLPLNKPFRCLDPTHADSNPSMSFDKVNNRVVCFSCGVKYDIFDLVKIEYNISDDREAFKRTYELLNISVDSEQSSGKPLGWDATIGSGKGKSPSSTPQQIITPQGAAPTPNAPEKPKEYPIITGYINECAARAGQTDYFSKRGLSADTVQRFSLGYDPNFDPSAGKAPSCVHWKAVTIPNGERFCIIRNIDPTASGNNRYRKIGNNRLWNAQALYTDSRKPVFVVEGELDALSIIEAGGAALALGSATNYQQLLAIVDGRKQGFNKPLVIALDNDEAGNKAADALAEGLKNRGVLFYRENVCGNYKDANEALLADREGFIAAIAYINDTERREYAKKSAAGHIQEFMNGITESVNTPHISTGFEQLDAALDGGLYEGLYTLGAMSSLGKTTFALQIIDQIARSGKDCLIFSLEMARSQLMARSISRLTLQQIIEQNGDTRNAKSERGITAGERYSHYSKEEMELIKSAIQRYSDYAEHIYIHEGVGDIGIEQVSSIVKNHIRITGNAPVVLIDYLQILALYEPRMTDKQNTDKAVIELKRLSRDYKLAVICISSFNRDNYRAEVNESAFKESGAIEYSSDVLIGLQLKGAGNLQKSDIDEALQANPRQIELKIIKNRSGQRNIKVGFEYYPVFNYYREVGEAAPQINTQPAHAFTVSYTGRRRRKKAEEPQTPQADENGLVYSSPDNGGEE